MIAEAKRAHIAQQLKSAGVTITQSTNAMHLHRGQRTIVVTDLLLLDSGDLRALGAMTRQVQGRWRPE